MQDIGLALQATMEENQCSSFYAFLLLEGQQDGIYIHKSQSQKQPDGRLCDKGYKPDDGKRLG